MSQKISSPFVLVYVVALVDVDLLGLTEPNVLALSSADVAKSHRCHHIYCIHKSECRDFFRHQHRWRYGLLCLNAFWLTMAFVTAAAAAAAVAVAAVAAIFGVGHSLLVIVDQWVHLDLETVVVAHSFVVFSDTFECRTATFACLFSK
jgi:hypothetical protein